MNSPARKASGPGTGFDERLEILLQELELAVKWQRPCLVLVVYSSEHVRAEVEAALRNQLVELGQKSIHLSVKNRNPEEPAPFFREFKDPGHSVFLIDGLRWGGGNEQSPYATVSLQREYFVERQIRTLFWVTPNEMRSLMQAVPDFWAYRHRVIEFLEAPKPEQVIQEALESAWQGTGEYATEDGDTDAKISLRESMLTTLPEGEEARATRGHLLLTLAVLNWRRGGFEQASEQLQEALQIASQTGDNWFEAECFNALALIHGSTGRTDEAIDAYKQAIELAPDQIFVWNNLGNLCAKAGRNDEAMVAFRKALEGNARDPIAWNGLANAHFRLGYMDDAIAAYRKSLQYTPTFAQPWCGLGDVYASTGRVDEALKCYHKAIELNKDYVAPWMRLGVLYSRQERTRDAARAYRKALELDEKNSQAWNELGSIEMKSQSYAQAASAFAKAIDLDRGNGWAYSNLACAYMQQGKSKEGVSLLLRSIELLDNDSDKAVSWNRLADLYRQLSDYDNAVAAYQMADKLRTGGAGGSMKPAAGAAAAEDTTPPASPELEQVSWAMAAGGDTPPSAADGPTEDAEALETAPTDDAADAPAWIFAKTGYSEPAGAHSAGSVTVGLRAQGKEATMISKTKSESAPGASPVLRKSPAVEADAGAVAQDVEDWIAQGNAHFSEGDLENAIAAYNQAIQADPACGIPYSNLALAYVTQGQFAEAILLYQKSIELLESDRDKALSWNGLGNAYRCVDDYANAVAAYQRAAELDPETSGIRDQAGSPPSQTSGRSASGWNDLGELLLKTGALEKATEAFQSAIEMDPSFGPAYNNLARTKSAEGKYAEAIPCFERSIALLEDNKQKADAWNGLGNAYRKLNDYNSAINAYQKAVVLVDEGVDLLTRTRFSLLSNVLAGS
ncbi:MAG TPA: tetratricopeptide repeat protein [Anaerolineales bacterium]|nr:tetratricopeptide repeat protein [Anaerolineales bacterium]